MSECRSPLDRPSAAELQHAPRVVVAVVALALGGFAIGTTEFVTMGVLPDIADGVGVDIPSAGHVISAYALGVVVGAPVIAALSARLPRRALLVGLMAAFLVGNGLTALAPGYRTLLVARFLTGLPHGAYFGVASLVAASLVAPHLRGRAVSSVMLGLAAAMLTGVPAATWLGQQFGWRSAYWRSSCWRRSPSPPCSPSSRRCRAGRRRRSAASWARCAGRRCC